MMNETPSSRPKFEDMSEGQQARFVLKWIFYGLLILFLIIAAFSSFKIISAGHRGVVMRLGAVQQRIMDEGIHLKTPFIESVEVIDVREQKIQVSASSASKDLQIVATEIALNFHLAPEKVNKLWQEVGSEYSQRIIDPAIQEAVKAATAKFTAEELITKRPEVKLETFDILKDRLQKRFIIVDDFSITDFDFSKSFNDAIEAKVTAEQEALAAKNKLEQVKFEAQQRIEQAEGEARAIEIQARAIQTQGGREYVNLKAIEKWDGVLPVTTLGDSVPFINLPK